MHARSDVFEQVHHFLRKALASVLRRDLQMGGRREVHEEDEHAGQESADGDGGDMAVPVLVATFGFAKDCAGGRQGERALGGTRARGGGAP